MSHVDVSFLTHSSDLRYMYIYSETLNHQFNQYFKSPFLLNSITLVFNTRPLEYEKKYIKIQTKT